MRIGPKFKIARRLGPGIFEKTGTQKFLLSQSRKEGRGRRPSIKSDYGRQFLEKQKIRFSYGITERQLVNYVNEVLRSKKPGAEHFFSLLERRLDNVVYRLGLLPTRRAARQAITHGHITLNGKRVTVPSLRANVGEIVSLRAQSRNLALFQNLSESLKDHITPNWLSFDEKSLEGTIKSEPTLTETALHFDLNPVLEFYSR